MPDVFEVIQSVARNAHDALTVRTVYGDPITAGDVTIVPVAKMGFGFGGGGGGGEGSDPSGDGGGGYGGGGGGGGSVDPIGFIEITSTGSRWVPVEPPQSTQLLKALNSAARILPFAGRRGVFAIVALIAAQVLLSQFTHSREPVLPEDHSITK